MTKVRTFLASTHRAVSIAMERRLLRYVIALVIFGLAFALRLAIFPVEAGYAFFTFYPAVVLAALLCGIGPALMGIALSSLVIDYILIPPAWVVTFTHEAIASISVYVVSGVLICFILEKSRKGEVERSLLAAIVKSADVAIMSKTLDGIITSWNPEAERLFGYAPFETIGKSMSILYPPDSVDEEADLLAQIGRGECLSGYETGRVHKNGRPINVSVTQSPVLDPFGRIVGASVVDHDITKRKALEDGLVQSNKQLMAAITELKRSNKELDEFAYIASHDLKEPLRGIHNYVSFLQEDYANLFDDGGRIYLDRMKRLAERMTTLIDSLLALSRLGSTPLLLESVNVDAVVDGVGEDLKESLTAQAVELRRLGKLPVVTGNALRISEVFQNLIVNGAKYNDKREKWVEVGCDGKVVAPVFYVRDNGIGIPPQHRESVFRIFKRLHEQSKYGGGTGAGLTIVKKIIERHGGRIWLESEEGVGTTFYFTFTGGL